MNTKTLQVLGSLVLCIGSSACHAEHAAVTQPPGDPCEGYFGLTALLAQATVSCTGTIGPDSFYVNDNQALENKFSSCKDGPEGLEKVKKLLQLQTFHKALPGFQQCLAGRYKLWEDLFARTKLGNNCPNWTATAVVGEGESGTSKQLGKMQPKFPYAPSAEKARANLKPGPDQRFVNIRVPAKSSIIYEIAYPQANSACDDPAVCAAQCAAFLPGFVVSAAGNQLVADPASWYRDRTTTTCSASPTNDPWCPPDFVHQMSLYSTSSGPVPPGDLYGHPNRGNKGEHCDRWLPGVAPSPGFDYETDLVLECADPAQTVCLSRCGN